MTHRTTPTGHVLRLVPSEPTALERERRRIEAARHDRLCRAAQVAAAMIYTTTTRPRRGTWGRR